MNSDTKLAGTVESDSAGKDQIPPARKENGDEEDSSEPDKKTIGSPNDPVSDAKTPSSDA